MEKQKIINQFTGDKKSVHVIDGVPVFSEDIYWGKVPEKELKDIIDKIDQSGFFAFDSKMQKRLDFTYDEDRADWRVYVPLSKESTVLDIGAGLGRITIPLARSVGKVVACDMSVSRMRFLQRRAKFENLSNVEVIVADIFDLPFKEGSFDLIVMNGVLEWVGLTKLFQNPREAQIKALQICRKLLRKGGSLYIGIENRFAIVYLKAHDHGGLRYTSYMPRLIADIYSRLRGYGPYRTYTYSKRGYEKLLSVAGFDKPAEFYLTYPGYNLPRILVPYESLNIFKYLIKTFKRSDNNMKNFIYKIVGTSFVIRLYRYLFYSFGIIAKK